MRCLNFKDYIFGIKQHIIKCNQNYNQDYYYFYNCECGFRISWNSINYAPHHNIYDKICEHYIEKMPFDKIKHWDYDHRWWINALLQDETLDKLFKLRAFV